MYGYGIRISYYLQWYGLILAAWIAPSEVESLRITNAFFVSATFLALVVQIAQGTLKTVEIYIILLLTFGSSLYLLPLILWRFLTCFQKGWDPSRFPRARPPSKVFRALNVISLLAALSFQLWFWTTKVHLGDSGCENYGFLFTKVRLNNPVFKWLNFALCAMLLTTISILNIIRLLNPIKLVQRDANDLSGWEYVNSMPPTCIWKHAYLN